MAITRKIFIKINSISGITEFLKQAEKVCGDVTVYRGKYVVDGKSLMGLFSIDVSEGVQVEFPEDETDFADFLMKYKA